MIPSLSCPTLCIDYNSLLLCGKVIRVMQHHEEAPRDPAAENASTDETLAAFRDLWLNDIQRATSTPTSATSINRLAGPATRERPGEEDRSASPSPERRAHVKQTPTTPLGWYQFAIFSEAEGHLDDGSPYFAWGR